MYHQSCTIIGITRTYSGYVDENQIVRINHTVFLVFTLVNMLASLPCTMDNAVGKCQMMLHFTSYIQYLFFHHWDFFYA